jgi:hypothetical protein
MVSLITQNSFIFTFIFIDKTIIPSLCVICNVVGDPGNRGSKFLRKKIHFNQTTRRRTPEQNLKSYIVIADIQSNTRSIILCTETWIFLLLKDNKRSRTQQVLTFCRLHYWILSLRWAPSLQRIVTSACFPHDKLGHSSNVALISTIMRV